MRLAVAAVLVAGCATSATPDELAGEKYHEANGFFAQGRYSEAIPLYESAIAIRDRMKDAYHRLAYCYEIRGEESRAVETLEKVLRVDRQDEYSLRHLWRLYCRRGFPEQALGAARSLATLYPEDRGLKDEIARLEGLKLKELKELKGK
jgi:tetratricopeptide (TPR) repeat protein